MLCLETITEKMQRAGLIAFRVGLPCNLITWPCQQKTAENARPQKNAWFSINSLQFIDRSCHCTFTLSLEVFFFILSVFILVIQYTIQYET